MAKAKGAALAKDEPNQVAMAAGVDMPEDWLSDILGDDDIDVTGTEEMDQEDVRLPTWLLNSKKEDKEKGNQCPDDVFWNSLTERGKPRLRLVVLTNHKSRLWRESNGNDELVVRCKSWDSETGEMDDGRVRSCKGCPDYAWQTNEKGKRTRRCTDVHNVLAMDRETREIGVIKVKKTALRGWKDFYQQHFHKKRPKKLPDGRVRIVDLPFFAVETIVEAEKKTGGAYTWYVPRFELGGALPKEEILGAADFVKYHVAAYLERAEKTEEDSDDPAAAGPDVVDSSEFADDDGPASDSQTVIDGSGGASANRF